MFKNRPIDIQNPNATNLVLSVSFEFMNRNFVFGQVLGTWANVKFPSILKNGFLVDLIFMPLVVKSA